MGSHDPFEIKLDDFLKLPLEERLELRRKAFMEVKGELARLFVNGCVYACFCGSTYEPAFTAPNLGLAPNATRVVVYVRNKNKPSFEFFKSKLNYVRELPL